MHLGIYIQSNLSWEKQVTSIVKKVNLKLSIINSVKGLSRQCLDVLYKLHVRSSIDYQFASRARSGRKREKALSRLRSRPQPGRAERKLCEIYKKISSISLWEREEKHHSTCRDLNPCPPPELPPDLPAPKRRSCGRRGGPCVTLLPYHST